MSAIRSSILRQAAIARFNNVGVRTLSTTPSYRKTATETVSDALDTANKKTGKVLAEGIEMGEEAAQKAKEMAGVAQGKANEAAGEASGSYEQAKGTVKGKAEEAKGTVKGKYEEAKGQAKGQMNQ